MKISVNNNPYMNSSSSPPSSTSTSSNSTTNDRYSNLNINMFIPAEFEKLKHSIAGAVAGGVSSVVTCPLDVVKTRLQNQGKVSLDHRPGVPFYHGTGSALKRIWLEEGIQGLYRGLGPTMYGYLPTWAIYFSAYDYFKLALSENAGKNIKILKFKSREK